MLVASDSKVLTEPLLFVGKCAENWTENIAPGVVKNLPTQTVWQFSAM